MSKGLYNKVNSKISYKRLSILASLSEKGKVYYLYRL